MSLSGYSRQAAALVLVHGVEVGVQVDQRHGAASEVPGGAENTPGQRVVTPDTWRHERGLQEIKLSHNEEWIG